MRLFGTAAAAVQRTDAVLRQNTLVSYIAYRKAAQIAGKSSVP